MGYNGAMEKVTKPKKTTKRKAGGALCGAKNKSRTTIKEKSKKPSSKPKEPKRKLGRPNTNTNNQLKEIQTEICERIATTSKSLRQICKDMVKDFDNMPHYRNVVKMLATDKDFYPQYAQAKLAQAELLFDEILEISDDSSLDMAFTEEGKPFIDHEHVNRSRLRVDSRKFYIAKILPKKYSEKHEVTGKDGGPVEFMFKVIYDDAPKGNSEE